MSIWFNNKPLPTDPIEQMKYYLDYMEKIVEQPEKWALVGKMSMVMRGNRLPKSVVMRMLKLDARQLNVTLSLTADTETIDWILESSHLTPWMISGIINNKKVTKEQIEKCRELSGDSPRDIANQDLIEHRLKKFERNT